MSFVKFLFREGSSILFALFLLAFVYLTPEQGFFPHTTGGLFFMTLLCLGYLALQMGMAAFAQVGHDKPLLDLFFSLIPMFALFGIVLLAAIGQVALSGFHVYCLIIAGLVTVMDVIFNTQVLFKMNRLATDMVQMR